MSLEQLLSVLTLNAGYNTTVVIVATSILGIATGVVGVFAMLRKRTLMGDALAHSTLAGIVLMFVILTLLGLEAKNTLSLLAGASIAAILGVITVQLLTVSSRLQEEAAIGIVLSVFFGFGILLLSLVQALSLPEAAGLQHFIYGQTAAMLKSDAYFIGFAALLILSICGLLQKEFGLISFDPDFANVQGWRNKNIDFMLMLLVAFSVVVGLQAVGIILIVALLIIPASAARFWSDRLSYVLTISAFIGGLSCYIGAALSALVPQFPAGAVIVLTSGAFFIVSFLFAPKRGLIAGFYRILNLRVRVFKDHLLREIYEAHELNKLAPAVGLTLETLPILNRLNFFKLQLVLFFVRIKGLIRVSKRTIYFTELGLAEALRLTRNHRLWEQYLIDYADGEVSHVDYSADLVEHVLDAELIAILEERIAKRDNIESVHPL